MEIFYLLLGICGLTTQNVSRKIYSRRGGGGTFIFSAISCLSACLFFLISSGFELHFTAELIPYILLFAVSYGSAVVFSFLSIKTGPLSVTSLISSYSLVIPTLYGLVVFHEQVGVWFYVGVALLALSLLFINMKKGTGGVKITLSWAIFVILAFAGNGMCSTVQAVQQRDFVGQYKSELMISSLLVVSAVLLILAFTVERREIGRSIKRCGYMIVCGAANGATNLMVMLLVGMMNASLMYPLLSAGNILLTTVFSVLVFKEKLTKLQTVGLVLGIASVVFMNI